MTETENEYQDTLHIVVQAEFIRMRTQCEGLDFVLLFVGDPGVDHVLGEHVAAEEEFVILG